MVKAAKGVKPKHLPLAVLKDHMRALPKAELPGMLIEIVRLCCSQKVFGKRPLGDIVANMVDQIKGL